MKRTALVLTLATSLAGCATDRPLNFACPGLTRFLTLVPPTPGDGGGVAAAASASPALSDLIGASLTKTRSLAEAQARPGTAAAADTPAFLVLSGGGQWGAYGATFLQGWSQNGGTGDAARPNDFQIVTGVSTGALQATFAFLGKGHDQGLVNAYTISDEKELLDRHGSTFFISHGSMADTAPLERYVRARLKPLLDRVKEARESGRILLVGMVDGLDGQMYAVNLTEIAAQLAGDEREDCYVGALLASAAVPVVFRQVTINGRPYLDGGVRHSVFITEVQQATGQALDKKGLKGNLYVVMNGDITPTSIPELPAKLLPTVNRLRSIVFNQIELGSLYGAATAYPGLRTRFTTAAGNTCKAPQDEESEVFNPTMMTCLRNYGTERWTQGNPWAEYPVPSK